MQSDHGQTNGATFKQRYGLTLDDLVRRLMPSHISVYSKLSSNEDHFGQVIIEPGKDAKRYLRDKKDIVLKNGRKLRVNTLKTFKDSPLVKGKLADYIKNYKVKERPEKVSKENADVIVLASGNMGLIYLTQLKNRLSYESINELYPDLIPGIVQHEGVGFIMVNSSKYGPLAIGNEGIHYLKDNTVEGKDPLVNFGSRAVEHLIRTNSFEYTPDILVNSLYDSEKDEVAAFEELIGSHGGLGGDNLTLF